MTKRKKSLSKYAKNGWFDFYFRIANFKIYIAENYLSHFVNLFARIYIGCIFWKSGTLKHEFWENTILLFTYEHPVPYLSPEIAAYLGTYSEIIFAAGLMIGLGARICAFLLMVITLLIEFTYLSIEIHQLWAIILALITVYGPGSISLDYFLRKKLLKSYEKL